MSDPAPQHTKRCPQCHKTFGWNAEFCDDDHSWLDDITPPQDAAAPQVVPPEPDSTPTSDHTDPSGGRPDLQAASPPKSGVLGRAREWFTRMGARQSSSSNPGSRPGSGPGAAATSDYVNPLPNVLIQDGWRVHEAPNVIPNLAHFWKVQRADTHGVSRAQFTRYNVSVLTTPAVYAQIRSNTNPYLPTVHGSGTVEVSGDTRLAFDLCAIPSNAEPLTRLAEWLRQQGPSEATALAMLPAVIDLLKGLEAAGLMPLVLSPEQLAWRAGGGLMLTRVATLTRASSRGRYREDFENSGWLSTPFAAPELAGENMEYAEHCAVFSVGQLLAEAVWGQPCSRDTLQQGDIPIASLSDTRLATVLQGCLWSNPATTRWTVQQLLAARDCTIEELPAVPDWASLCPQAAKRAYVLEGKHYWRADALLRAAMEPALWELARTDISLLLDWLEEATPWASVARLARQQLHGGQDDRQSADHVLLSLTRRICPDLPLTWRSLSLCDNDARQSLIGLAQDSLQPSPAGDDARRLLDDLINADLRGAFHPP